MAGALPGDHVDAEPVRTRPRFVESVARVRLRDSPLRRTPPCRYQPECGGCPWMALDENEQARWKRRLVADALARIGGLARIEPEEILRPVPALAYRNRIELALAAGAGRTVLVGLRRAWPEGGVVDIERCLLQHEAAQPVLEAIRGFAVERADGLFAALSGGAAPRVLIRRSELDGGLLVGLWDGPEPFPLAEALAARLAQRCAGLRSVVRLRATSGRRGGVRAEPLVGPPWLHERLCGTRFRLPAAAFAQVNAAGAEALCRLVVEHAGDLGGGEALDLYGGVGAFACALARNGARRVTLCEADAAAVAAGQEAAAEHGLAAVRCVHDDVGRFLRGRAATLRAPGFVVANPPRRGLGPGVAAALGRLGTPRIALVSCDPATLGRDAGALVRCGYALRRVTPLDLFPQTHHVESVAWFEREA